MLLLFVDVELLELVMLEEELPDCVEELDEALLDVDWLVDVELRDELLVDRDDCVVDWLLDVLVDALLADALLLELDLLLLELVMLLALDRVLTLVSVEMLLAVEEVDVDRLVDDVLSVL